MSCRRVDLRVVGMTTSPASRVRLALRLVGIAVILSFLASSAVDAQAAIGLSSVRAQAFFNEEIDGFPPEPDDYFGWSLAAGDFNGDGAQDLATGIPLDNGPVGLPLMDAGAVIVRWGVAGKGLSATLPPTVLSLYAAGGTTQAHIFDYFGHALAAGDFNGDGRDDLAVGIPFFRTDGDDDPDAGAVQIHFGLPTGIELAGAQLLYSGPEFNTFDPTGYYDHFGHTLAAGDFDGDGFADLAIGAPQPEGCGGCVRGGAVIVLHGSISGLLPVVGYLIHQDDPLVPDDEEDPDDFGWALAVGNFNGDLRCLSGICRPIDDLAMSAPGEDGEGAVMVMLGSEFGLIFTNSTYLGQFDVGGTGGEAGDRFGASLASGNFDGDCCDDLAIGHPDEDLGASNQFADAGEVTVLYGAAGGYFDLPRTDHLVQSTIFGSSAYDQAGDLFGFALAAGDFDRDGRDDLAIGQPGEDVGGSDRGGATVLMGGVGGLYDRFRFLAAGINGVLPGPQDGSKMGRSVGVGDLDGDGYSDLAVGIPYRDQGGISRSGAESILYGALFADGFVSGNDDFWSLSNP